MQIYIWFCSNFVWADQYQKYQADIDARIANVLAGMRTGLGMSMKDSGPSENYCCNHISIASSLTPSPNFLFPLSISLMFCSVITNRLLLRGGFSL